MSDNILSTARAAREEKINAMLQGLHSTPKASLLYNALIEPHDATARVVLAETAEEESTGPRDDVAAHLLRYMYQTDHPPIPLALYGALQELIRYNGQMPTETTPVPTAYSSGYSMLCLLPDGQLRHNVLASDFVYSLTMAEPLDIANPDRGTAAHLTISSQPGYNHQYRIPRASTITAITTEDYFSGHLQGDRVQRLQTLRYGLAHIGNTKLTHCSDLQEVDLGNNNNGTVQIVACDRLKTVRAGLHDMSVLELSRLAALEEVDLGFAHIGNVSITGCRQLNTLKLGGGCVADIYLEFLDALATVDTEVGHIGNVNLRFMDSLKEYRGKAFHVGNVNVYGCDNIELISTDEHHHGNLMIDHCQNLKTVTINSGFVGNFSIIGGCNSLEHVHIPFDMSGEITMQSLNNTWKLTSIRIGDRDISIVDPEQAKAAILELAEQGLIPKLNSFTLMDGRRSFHITETELTEAKAKTVSKLGELSESITNERDLKARKPGS
ncbi:MAG: hypothetical protein EB060_06555 [Proteobacteria bacterium]|nr:hypothetical protein [Pseudomonadota bacterium]